MIFSFKRKRIISSVNLAIIISLLSFNAFSATVIWDGGAFTSNWDDATNWSSDAVPLPEDNVEINVTGGPVVTTATPITINSLILGNTNDSATLTLGASF